MRVVLGKEGGSQRWPKVVGVKEKEKRKERER